MGIYRSLIRSKIDYGCIVYKSASSRILESLESVSIESLRTSGVNLSVKRGRGGREGLNSVRNSVMRKYPHPHYFILGFGSLFLLNLTEFFLSFYGIK